eukprot:15352717-Ditylum_brightwellii.AAC.1
MWEMLWTVDFHQGGAGGCLVDRLFLDPLLTHLLVPPSETKLVLGGIVFVEFASGKWAVT